MTVWVIFSKARINHDVFMSSLTVSLVYTIISVAGSVSGHDTKRCVFEKSNVLEFHECV